MECFTKIFSIIYLISFSGIEEGSGECNPGSYLNLCGYCVGGRSDKSELEGLDRCGICDGQSDCVKCDGLINSPRRRDLCGLCLLPEAEEWNDCRKIDKVHPPVIDLVLETDVIALTITGAGFRKSFENSTQCLIQPLESQVRNNVPGTGENSDNPEIKGLTYEENDIQLKIQLTKTTGAYRIGCSDFEGFAELTVVDSRKLNVLAVRPSEVEIDELIQLELEVEGLKVKGFNEKYWCFVKIKGGETLILEASQKSWNGITCSGFTPVSPGRMIVGVVANEIAAFNENGTGKTGKFAARSKAPKAESAEYSPDLRSIAVMFDRNIQISDCGSSFSPETVKSFGVGFTCSAFGNQLKVNLGSDFEITETLAIVPNNSICHSETKEAKLSPVAESTVLAISKEKVVAPSVSLSAPSLICTDTEKQPGVRLRISILGEGKLQHVWSVPPSKKGKSQRENMMIWKNSRAIEAELKNKSGENDILLTRTNLLPGNDYVIRLRSTNALGDKHDATASFTVKEAGSISVTVTTFPSASAIVAEATIVKCKDQSNIRYRWMIDGKVIAEDRKFLNVPQRNRGTYNVSCEVFEHRSNKILGWGWSLTEIVNIPGRVIIFPAEAVFGTMDDIVLQAYSDEARFRWACTNSIGESCIAVGSTGKPIEDITSVTSSRIRIPAGTLPVGRYEWTVYSTEEATATVIVSSKIPPLITIPPPPSRVDSTKPFFLNADVGRLKEGCSIRWKSIHKKGYSYFNLAEDIGLGDPIHIRFDDLVTEEREAPLIIPTAGGRWKGLIGNEKYLLRLEAICPKPVPEAHTDITLFVNGPPDVPNFSINPKTGEAVNTKFTVRINRITDEVQDYPLMYEISYKDQNNDKILLGTSFFPYYQVSLPPGKVTVTVRACDIWKSCSKSTKQVTVQEPSNISPQTIKNLERDIQNLILSGDAIEAYGKAISALKTFSAKDLKPELNAISSATESAVKTRIQILSENLRSNSEIVKLSFEFLEQSVSSLKYFPEPNGMVKLLTDFKNSITKLGRIKRGAGTDPGGPILAGEIIKSVFHRYPGYLDNSGDEVNEARLRKFELDMCSENLTSFLIADELTGKDLPREFSVVDDGKAKIVLKKVTIRYRNCLAMARYLRNLPIDLRSLNVFELRVATKETLENEGILVTLPFYHEYPERKCFAWGRDWNEICNFDWLSHKMIKCRCDNSDFSSIYQGEIKTITAQKQTMEQKLDSLDKRAKEFNGEMDYSENALTFANQTVRIKRSADNEPINENTLKAIFDLHGKILEQNDIESNREEFLADVKKYMTEACSVIQDTNQDSILIESSIVTLEIKKLTQNDNKKDLSIVGGSNAKLKFSFKTPPRKSCTGIAKYPKDFFGNSSFDRVSDIYDVRLIKNGTVKEEFKSDIKSISITMPIRNNVNQEVVSCMSWNTANGWTPQCTLNSKSNNTITCNCKTPGIFALFTMNTKINNITLQPVINVASAANLSNTTITPQITVPATTSTTMSTTTANITAIILNTTTIVPPNNETTTLPMAIVVTNSTKSTNASTSTTIALVLETTTTTFTTTTITTTTTTTTTTANTNTTTATTTTTANNNITPPPLTTANAQKNTTTNEKNILASVIQNISNIRKNSSLQVSGTFRIDENYKSVVGKNSTIFVESLRKQLAEQLSIPEKAIANIIVKPGSIMVTVLFVDTKELTAEDAIKELVTKLHDGTLSLTGQNSNVLNVPRQDLQIKIGPSVKRNSGRIRLITYGVVVGTCLAIFLFVLGAAYFRRKRSRVLLRLPRLSVDDHPIYRQFHNEFSLDGSSASLARYRREHPFETETIQ